MIRSALGCAMALVAAMACGGMPSAQALTAKECSAKYKAAQQAGTLNGMKWNDFRKAECGSTTPQATASPAATSLPDFVAPHYRCEANSGAGRKRCVPDGRLIEIFE